MMNSSSRFPSLRLSHDRLTELFRPKFCQNTLAPLLLILASFSHPHPNTAYLCAPESSYSTVAIDLIGLGFGSSKTKITTINTLLLAGCVLRPSPPRYGIAVVYQRRSHRVPLRRFCWHRPRQALDGHHRHGQQHESREPVRRGHYHVLDDVPTPVHHHGGLQDRTPVPVVGHQARGVGFCVLPLCWILLFAGSSLSTRTSRRFGRFAMTPVTFSRQRRMMCAAGTRICERLLPAVPCAGCVRILKESHHRQPHQERRIRYTIWRVEPHKRRMHVVSTTSFDFHVHFRVTLLLPMPFARLCLVRFALAHDTVMDGSRSSSSTDSVFSYTVSTDTQSHVCYTP